VKQKEREKRKNAVISGHLVRLDKKECTFVGITKISKISKKSNKLFINVAGRLLVNVMNVVKSRKYVKTKFG
jgi:hypothetical protein